MSPGLRKLQPKHMMMKRRKKSEVSDETSATSKHVTRSQKTATQTHDDEVTHVTVKEGKRKAKEFQTKPIPDKKKKNTVDANEIIKKHTKTGVDDHEEEAQQRTTQISKTSDRKAYATRSKGSLECHEDPQNVIGDKSEHIIMDGKKIQIN